MLHDHDKFKNVTGGIQSIAIAVAVLIGGAWTAYTFSALRTEEQAQTDLAKSQLDIATQRAKEEREQASAQLAIEQSREEREQRSAQLAIDKAKAEREEARIQLEMSIQKAKNDREQAAYKSQQDRTLAEQRLLANYGLDIAIEAKQDKPAGDEGYYISAVVKITNKGVENRFINFNKSPLVVQKIGFNDDGNSNLHGVIDQRNVLSESIVLRTGTTVTYPLLVKVLQKGFYVISFGVELNNAEKKIHVLSGGPNVEGISWVGSTYVLVN